MILSILTTIIGAIGTYKLMTLILLYLFISSFLIYKYLKWDNYWIIALIVIILTDIGYSLYIPSTNQENQEQKYEQEQKQKYEQEQKQKYEQKLEQKYEREQKQKYEQKQEQKLEQKLEQKQEQKQEQEQMLCEGDFCYRRAIDVKNFTPVKDPVILSEQIAQIEQIERTEQKHKHKNKKDKKAIIDIEDTEESQDYDRPGMTIKIMDSYDNESVYAPNNKQKITIQVSDI